MKIIEIEEFSKNKCKLLLEDFSGIVLYKKDLKKYRLAEGLDLSDKQLKILLEEILPYRAKSRCMKLLQSKDYTESEIRKKLQADGYPETVIDIAVGYLYGYHYLDDEKYVKLYYQSRCLKKSRKQIVMDLQQKGIAKESIMTVLDEYILNNGENEEIQCIKKLLLKKRYCDKDVDITEREKVKAYLFRKGFQINDINVCMRNFDWKNM